MTEPRVTTHFNFYARLWVDSIMRSIQESDLEVVRQRAERREGSASWLSARDAQK
jgi:hypothetical protein